MSKEVIVRVVGNGYDKNGNYTYKVSAYKRSAADQKILDYMPADALKACVNGRMNREKRYVLTQDNKMEIMESFEKNGYSASYIFE